MGTGTQRHPTVRIRFSKQGKVRFTSHRDVARIWERALRRAELPVARSEGFNPHPRLSFGLALPTGAASLGEYLDIDLTERVAIEDLAARLDPCLPVGFHVQGAAEIEPGTPSLQQAVVSCTWRTELRGPGTAELAARLDGVLAAETHMVTRERKGKSVTDDVRPAILALRLDEDTASGTNASDGSTGTFVVAELATQPRALRPDELVGLLGPDLSVGLHCRLHQWIHADGALVEPIPLDPSATPAGPGRPLEGAGAR